MPLTRLNDEYLEGDGVRFLMKNEDGAAVACRVSHQALRDQADRLHFTVLGQTFALNVRALPTASDTAPDACIISMRFGSVSREQSPIQLLTNER